MQTQVNEQIKVLGEITAKFYDQTTLKDWERALNIFLRKNRKVIGEKMFQKSYRLGELKMVDEKKNVICNNGFNAITRLLTGDTTYTGEINKAILGTGVGSASASDTQLITEAYRNDIASGTAVGNIAYMTAFFTEVECSGTYKEFGNCIDGTASANTGRLWSHLAGLNWVKDNTIALVISCKYTFASA